MNLPLPEPDPDDPPPTLQARNAATCLAVIILAAMAVGFAFLMSAVFPTGFYMMLVVAAAGLFFGLHYLLWGRLLSNLRDEDDDPE